MRAQEFVAKTVPAQKVLQYVKQAQAPDEFNIEYSITDHPEWQLTNIPLSQLKLDPDGEQQDPYRRVNWVDYDKVAELVPRIESILKSMPIVVDANGWIIDGNHRATAAAEAGMTSVPAYVPAQDKLSDKNLSEDVYGVLDSYQCGPFDGGCVLVAQALQKIHGGDVVVLVDQNDQAQHAAVAVNGQLMDYSGAADPEQFVRKFETDERVNITNVRLIRSGDLPDAPSNDPQVIDQLVQALSENSDNSSINPKKLEILGHLKTMPLTVFGSTATKSLQDANDFDVFLDLDANPEHKKYVKSVLNLSYRYYGWIDPFVIKDGVLHVRNDTATGWTRAKNAQAILKNIRAQGRPIDQITENFADGRKPGRKGLSKRVGIPKKASLSQLQKIASNSTGERRRMAQWQLNMRRGKAKK